MKNNLISIKVFNHLYNSDGDRNLAYVYRLNGNKYVYFVGKTLMIDIKPLVRRRDFFSVVQMTCQERYWMLRELMPVSRMVEFMEEKTGRHHTIWRSFTNKSLFSQAFYDSNVLRYKIPAMMWEFFKYTAIIERDINAGRNIDYIKMRRKTK